MKLQAQFVIITQLWARSSTPIRSGSTVERYIMYYLYILQNQDTGRYYIGSTNNLNRRMIEHKKGKTRTTRVLGTLNLVYKETFNTNKEARLREKKLKSYKSRRYINWLIERQGPVAQR